MALEKEEEETKVLLVTDDITIAYIDNPRESTGKWLELMRSQQGIYSLF